MGFNFSLADFIDFRDTEACERVRRITREEIVEHENPEFNIRVIDDPGQFYAAFATDIVRRIKEKLDAGEQFVTILPVGPTPQFTIAARLINEMRIPMHHVHTFNMDEYADDQGNTAPLDWPGSFQQAMIKNFFDLIDPGLRPPTEQIHFPTNDVIDDYGKMMEDVGGVDVCYGGIGWCGHIAFWESHLGHDYEGDIEAYKQAKARQVTLHPMTIMQNALHSFSGDWSMVPPKANTIGPAEIMMARHRSFWLDGHILGDVTWQRFIARLVAHGPVDPLIPGSILQTARTDYTLLGGVADNVVVNMR